jgi:hypothetical protein
MLKSYEQLNRQSGRLIYVEFDPLLGELLVSVPVPAQTTPAPQIICDVDLGELAVSPDAPGNPRQTLAPPRCRPAKLAGEC